MVRITKTMQARHSETLSPLIKDFRSSACSTPLPLLPQHLSTLPTRWPFPRGDLYHWVSLLNRFDVILERFCRTYKLDEGPQTLDFSCQILESANEEQGDEPHEDYDLEKLGFDKEGDRQLIESILNFSRMLLQNCGNRSIYASSSHLSNLLNTTSLSLLESTLLIGSELAQRYQAAFKRMNLPARHVSSTLLTNHYNINLDRVLQLALPFTKTVTTPVEPLQPATPTTPSVKGKEKAYFQIPTAQKGTTSTLYANDLASLVKGGSGVISGSPKAGQNGVDSKATEASWEQWGDVKVTYYPKATPEVDTAANTPRLTSPASQGAPVTPTPIRRSSNLGPHGHRSNRQTASDETPSPVARSATFPMDDAPRPTYNVVEISSSKLKSTSLHTLLREHISELPQELQYELLAKLRVASALTTSLETRRQMLSVRLLAITNLAYIHSENVFLENVLKQDSDEPRRLQLVYQLAEMVHPPADGDVAIPRKLQTLALSALDALSSHQSKFSDVCAALNTNVNHGVLLYVVRRAVAEMHHEDSGDKITEDDEWRDTLFSLLSNLSLNPRTSGDLVTAGLIPILVEVLNLRTNVAERYHPKILSFLDNIMYNARDAFQTLVSAEGLDAVSDLIVFEVKNAAELAAAGNGIRPEYRSAAVDYKIPYFQQQTLKWLLKFIHHMMSAAGGYGGNFDRLLRNLIDSSQLLGALRQIISNAHCFGSIVWTNAVSILNDFINNEPTSFAIIAEAGLSRAFLEAVTGTSIVMPQEPKKREEGEQPTEEAPIAASMPIDRSSDDDDDDDTSDDDADVLPHRPSLSTLQTPRDHPLAQGIMPTSETINIVPQAFGAICLNNAGMKMFQASRALESFLEIFESPEHVKCMDANKDLASNLGGTFDELVRHHPPLKTAIMNAILDMVARVGYLCKTKAEKQKVGAKLWTMDTSGKPIIADAQLTNAPKSHKGKEPAVDNGNDVEMQDADTELSENTTAHPSASEEITPNASMTPYITAVATFLAAIFGNSSIRSEFCAKGGIEYVLDLLDSPCLPYDSADGIAVNTLHTVIAIVAEPKPHLTIPSLLKRAQSAADELAAFANHSQSESFFAPFVDADARQSADLELLAKGTGFAKAFVNLHSLVTTLQACFQPSAFNHRNAGNSFNQLNVGDYYARLVQSLGLLLGRSLQEEMQLQKIVPGYWKNATRVKDSGFGEPVADNVLGVEPPSPGAEPSDVNASAPNQPAESQTSDLAATTADTAPETANKQLKVPTKAEQDSPYFKNFQTIRYLLGKMSRTVSPFFQTLGKALVLKRNPEGFQKQSHAAIARALADTALLWLIPSKQASPIEQYSYWIGMLHVLKEMLIDVSRVNERPLQIITIVLQAFKESGGFDGVNHILETFTKEICSSNYSLTENQDKTTEEFLKFELATAGTKNILSLYALIVSGKNVTESHQTVAMTTRAERDRSRPDHFSPPQFLVELRMAVLPIVRSLWRSDLIEKGSSQICEKLIEVIRTIANADSEANAIKRSDKIVPQVKLPRKTFKSGPEHLAALADSYDADLANEALYRCNNNLSSALEYCREVTEGVGRRYPVPEGDIAPSSDDTMSSRPPTSGSAGTATPDDHAMAIDSRSNLPMIPPPDTEVTSQNFDQLLSQFAQSVAAVDPSRPTSSAAAQQSATEEEVGTTQVTVDDLNEERDAIKEDLIDKCLDVINAHGDVTFEVADLITTVVNKSSDPSAQRKTVATTLVIALMSFAGEEDLRTAGKKIAAYANLLALMLRDKLFFAAAVGDLTENLSTLLSFVRLSPNHSSDEPSPWIAHILLVVEMLLSEDARPQKTKWTAPKDETEKPEPPVLEMAEPIVSSDERLELFDAILEILPRIGKDEALALAVLRILVILTRTRSVAQAMGEKKNIQRLFVMAKQLAGASSARIQSPLMIILRHIIEDDETIKQIMRSEIKSYFETSRQQRNVDVSTYLRGLAHTAIRNPELFVEATNEMVKFNRWTYASEGSGRHVSLILKDTHSERSANKSSDDPVSPTVQATEDLSIQDVKPSTEGRDSEMTDAAKSTAVESKLPVLENPDGVIHFLLCELLNYRDVEDKDPPVPAANQAERPGTPGTTATTATPGSSSDDTPMGGTASSPEQPPKDTKPSKPPAKPEFKAEDHPIYIYRCFILQCLTELLSSYNRTKIEFINFKRSAPPQAMTPSKPRSSVVNYLLFDLIPVGTLDHADTTALRKRFVTSSWADSVLTALLSKTGENGVNNKQLPYDNDDEPDLLFVRKFVLENILKAYREASSSTEPLDVKYSRMLALSDLMAHIMSGKENVSMSDTTLAGVSQKQLRRIMFEKGFIAALTASIADIDLNFPGAKRAVKYILRPLKTLSSTAVQLSELGLVSDTPGQNDDEEIESATSVSDVGDREETPDLFRNSTLGMFEPGREEDSSSESDDDEEEMYEGEYDEEMDYEDEVEDGDDVISDEDEEIDGMGPIEGLPGDHGVDVEVIMGDHDDDDDDDDEGSSGDDEDDSEDDDARVEIIDEIEDGEGIGDDDDMDEWESDNDDEGDEDDYEHAADQDEHELHAMEAMDMGGQLGHIVRALGGEDAAEMMERMEEQMEAEGIDHDEDEEDEDRLGPDFIDEGDEEEDDEDEDDMDEEEMLFEQGFTMDGPGPVPFGWEGEVEPPMVLHRRPRPGGFPPFPFFPGGPRDPLGGMSHRTHASVADRMGGPAELLAHFQRLIGSVRDRRSRTNPRAVPEFRSGFRSHRPGGPPPRSGDDGTNPLLQRNTGPGRDGSSRTSTLGSFLQAVGGPHDILDIGFSGRPFGETATAAILDEVIRSLPAIPGTIARNGQALQFHITTGPGHEFPRDLQAMFGMTRAPRFDARREAGEPGSAAFFTPQSTNARWLEEAKLLFGQGHLERAADLSNAIQAVLVPPAIEADKVIKAAEAERLRKLEEAKNKAEEERRVQEAKEAEEKAAREKQEAEEREAAARAEAEAIAAQGPPPGAAEAEAMDGVETTEAPDAAEEEQPEAGPAEDRPRVTTIIRGNPYDITDLGIDADFLAELPDDIREEVIMSAVAERRSQAAATGAQPSEIDQEFLDALPDDIRDEIIQQELQDRRRRERDERNRQAAPASGGASAEMDPASILATLPAALRHQVLMEQDEEMLALLPQDLAEQARAAQRDHPAHQGRPPPSFARRSGGPPVPEVDVQRPTRRATVQMLDKAGVATLLRLMFILQQGSLRNTLNSVLQNICQNRHNRSELLGSLLHILQDGSFDMTAVERSFAHLSLRAKQPNDKGPKTPQPMKRALTGISTNSITPANFEASPLMVVQQCLSSLVYLTQVNPHIPAFFLTEHEPAGGLKRSLSRKGKGKETKAAKYPLNSLLSLLDRELIMESSSVMESLSTLLNMTTSPLQALQRKQKEAAEEPKKTEESTSATGAPETNESSEIVATNEHAPEQQSHTATSQEPEAATTTTTPTQPSPEAAENGEPSASTEAPTAQPEASSKEPSKAPEKKQRPMVPPVIPDHNLKLVINIFVARECSSKTFRETLSTIKNFSAIPGAKAVFGRELISKAQALGEIILVDLEDLLPQIQKASSGTEIQGVALAKFSPGGSDQNKLLRVLTALDHLFDPKRDRKENADADAEGESSQLVEKQDLLSSLYENSTFGPMWEKLSECLRAIRQREHMLNVATILLPLIEALMVVCKNTTLKDTPISRSMTGKEMLLTSPPPESRMESLFFTFTEEHRKILNDLVRHTPKLMSGTFSLLVKNPKVLEFDNKRNYFNRSVHAKAPNGRQSFPPLQLSVRRDQVFHDSFKSLYFQTGDQMKYGKLSIRFHGEEGVDAGGVTREWFQVLSRQMFDPGYALFIPVSSDRTTFHPNQLSSINEEHLMFFKFIGRIIGKALYEGRVLDCHFSRAVYKRILGKPVSVKDMESLDPEYYKSLVWMLENDITDIITETFSVDNDKFGVVETIDFIPNGRNIPVTEDNKHEYIRLMVEWKLTGSVQEQLDDFLKGFHDIIPAELIAIFNEQELELLISGLPEIDVDDWKSNTEYHNYSASSPQIQWFWRALRSFDKEERAKLLQFVTGTSKVPLNGFKELEGMNGFSRFNIHRDYGNKDRLPSSHTCFNQLDLPEYESYEALRQQVLTAITAGSEYFGFA
ncbi:Hect, E3 ligase [Venustampulla echinocandica]|uniref:HECT-type E3 ubiquitin transferase n=1 Tax=Venustampulla echinocandica TaxID=2656787 RepID=A0A370TXC6_9HELO|nr:Hect, E3 ligase [Venustampulla echinocandica]RDL40186.1 Hect, E3 ligase [Venustampulla echinocandica]